MCQEWFMCAGVCALDLHLCAYRLTKDPQTKILVRTQILLRFFLTAISNQFPNQASVQGLPAPALGLGQTPRQTFLGYTFSVMDVVASRAGMCRVKLVGDCYMAVAGLPGSADTPCRSAIFFAAWCAQVFSDRPARCA